MEMQEFLCPCGAILQVTPSFFGKEITCSACNTLLKIPSFAPENEEAANINEEAEEIQTRICPSCNYIGYEKVCPFCEKEMILDNPVKKKILCWIIPFLTFIFGFFIGILL